MRLPGENGAQKNTMTDDTTNGLTRRRVLGGFATIGAAGALGAGTWSRYNDSERKQVTATAGVLDLTVDGENGKTIDVNAGTLANGEQFTDCETLKNAGNVDGKQLRVDLTNLQNDENGLKEPEREAGDDSGQEGEFSDFLLIKGRLKCEDTTHPCTPGTDRGVGFVPLTDAVAADEFVVDLEPPLGPSAECELCFTLRYVHPDGEYTNTAMSDVTQFDIELTLEQYADDEYPPSNSNGNGKNKS